MPKIMVAYLFKPASYISSLPSYDDLFLKKPAASPRPIQAKFKLNFSFLFFDFWYREGQISGFPVLA